MAYNKKATCLKQIAPVIYVELLQKSELHIDQFIVDLSSE